MKPPDNKLDKNCLDWGFTNRESLSRYALESYINGQKTQAKEIWKDLMICCDRDLVMRDLLDLGATEEQVRGISDNIQRKFDFITPYFY